MKLFPKDKVVGIFRGFSEGGLEFHADLILPYKNEYQRTPMHGQFLLVQLEHEDEAVLGRITSVSAQGRLASGSGEDYGLRAVAEDRPIPEDLREQYLKYQIDIRVLGVLRLVADRLEFAPSHRRLPHVGSKVAFLSDDVLREVAGHNEPGAEIAFFALGEFVYGKSDNGVDQRLAPTPWMQVQTPAVIPKFQMEHLVARRSFVFARAGFGKSNMVKLLFSQLYQDAPTVTKRGGRKVPVGTIIFDPEGEYFWPDDKDRPGLCDVPHLQEQIVVFTNKKGPSEFYASFIGSGIRLDIRRLRPSDVISIALPSEKQGQQNVQKLKGLNQTDWKDLVDEVYRNGNAADPNRIRALLRLDDGQDAEMVAARANLTTIVRLIHDPSSQMMDVLLAALKDGKLCIVDVSQMRGAPALILSGLILQRIFDHNQEEFTKAQPETIPTIAVLEEAQSVLGSFNSSGEGPYIAWVKEGRKYDLGAVLITQQPGSINHELLSQGDNWFVFHLLSSGDLLAVKKANAHFSDDILSVLLNEPIPGHGVFWSSAGGKTYPLPIRVLSFEKLATTRDPQYQGGAVETAATRLKNRFERMLIQKQNDILTKGVGPVPVAGADGQCDAEEPVDALEVYSRSAFAALKADVKTLEKIRATGVPWRGIVAILEQALPTDMDNRSRFAYDLTRRALDEVLGKEQWKTESRPAKRHSGNTTYVIMKPAVESVIAADGSR